MLNKIKNRLFYFKKRVSVIIPALNEEKTIAQVINLVKQNKYVNEIIVVDDNSVDKTIEIAKQEGATVITSKVLGKGHSMYEGLQIAKNDIVVFVDADIEDYSKDLIEKLIDPIIKHDYDFVKSTFDREAGRVTELVAKPLLSILFPELTKFSQPLSGMIAAKKSFLQKCTFENDYGVDIGLLIDAFKLNAKITEVHIGYLTNKSKPWQQLGKMSKEVAAAILKRAQDSKAFNLDTLETINLIQNEMEKSLNSTIKILKKIIIFDMDNTILKGRFIYKFVQENNLENQLLEILSSSDDSYIRTKNIALLLKNQTKDYLLTIADSIPIVDDTKEVIAELKNRGYLIGIISDSYDLITEHIKNKIGADFSLANQLIIKNNICTGEVTIPSIFLHKPDSICNHNYCKTNALNYICNQFSIPINNIIAIGDSENDICMVKNAGIGIAFRSDNQLLNSLADYVITKDSFSELLNIAN